MKVYGFAKDEKWIPIKAEAIKMKNQGYSYPEIAHALNVGETYIRTNLKIEGYHYKDNCSVWKKNKQQELEDNILKYNSFEEVANAMKMTVGAIRARVYDTIGTTSLRKARKFIKGE